MCIKQLKLLNNMKTFINKLDKKILRRTILVLLGLLLWCASFLGIVRLIALLLPNIFFFPLIIFITFVYILCFAVFSSKGIDYIFK